MMGKFHPTLYSLDGCVGILSHLFRLPLNQQLFPRTFFLNREEVKT